MTPHLPPMPQPGISLYPGYTANHPTTFLMKEQNSLHHSTSFRVFVGGIQAFSAKSEKRKELVFRAPTGQEIMRVVKESHTWSCKGEEYHGMRPDGQEMWTCKLHRGLSGTEYRLTMYPQPHEPQTLLVQNKVLGQDKGILFNGQVIATMSHEGMFKHLRREDVINVAPGMDVMLALGVAYVRYDKQRADSRRAAGDLAG